MEKRPMILVTEDEEINRKIICNLLKNTYGVIEADNGKVALELCRKYGKSISAILLDLTMPVMNGYEFMETITDTEWNNIPILVMTGSSDRETERKALDAGAIDFIKKPYDAMIIDIRLKNAIARSKLTMYEEIEHRLEYDKLTGLYSREKMFEETKEMIQRYPEEKFVFVRADIDHFALYNSSFGEKAGDELLKYFANMFLKSAAAFEKAVCGRISADIFCLCASFDGIEQNLQENISYAQKLLNDYSSKYLLKISAGACIIENRNTSIQEYYLRASLTAQRCKHQYGRIIEFYDETFRKQITTEIDVTNDMQRALDEDQFLVYFQTKYDITTEMPCGAEALVRWNHPEKGLISPGIFIPVFEKNGFIANLDYYMWEHTCRYLKKWKETAQNVKPVSVNISRVSLYNPNLDQVLIDLVKKYEIEPELLELEITESAYMTSPEDMYKLIRRLHAAGFTILMDDFGSDYSSLNALKDIEVDVLKIDMAFIPNDEDAQKGEIILTSIIRMAKWLGMTVIAEGVETRRQRDFLEGAGCDVIQGYYYARPVDAEEYEKNYVYSETVNDLKEKTRTDNEKLEENGTILLIDDQEITCNILKSYFESIYHIVSCYSAEEGLVYLKRNPDKVKLILVDNIMPGMSGIDFLHFCENSSELDCIPKIMVTASNRTEDQVSAFEAGAYDFITKPFVKEIVVARVKHIMETTYHYSNYDRIQMEYTNEAQHDELTGLLTEESFREISDRMLSTFPQDPMALLHIDVDDFAIVNQNCGYDKGTEILKQIAKTLKKEFRRSDMVGRIGEDSFGVFLCGIPSKRTAKQKSADVIKVMKKLGKEKYGIKLGVSIGLVYPITGDTMDVITAKAEQALLEAKHTARGSFVTYGESATKEEYTTGDNIEENLRGENRNAKGL